MRVDRLRLKHPIVLVHGLGARSVYGPFEYFYKMSGLLRDAGNPFHVARLSPWHSIEWRARQLREQIERAFPEGKVNLIGHSMGGLDSRYLVSALDFSERVASVTTIGTPNRGSMMGDLATGALASSALSAVDRLLKIMSYSNDGLKQISRRYFDEVLSQKLVAAPGVAYFSATSAIPREFVMSALPIFWIPHQIIRKYEGDNDGFISVESSRLGTHICTYVGDHYGQIGQILGRSRGLDYLKLYAEILAHLKREGM